MPETKLDRGFRWRAMLGFLAIGMVWLVFVMPPILWASVRFGLVCFIPGAAVGIFVLGWTSHRLIFGRYRCPQCGMALPVTKVSVGRMTERYHFICPHCDISWDTGLSD